MCRREGDFALVGAVVVLRMDDDATCQATRLCLFGVAGTPVQLLRAEAMLAGREVDGWVLDEVAQVVADDLNRST
jgi:CO/xanthine dehydrogenase FAD-binding subunit